MMSTPDPETAAIRVPSGDQRANASEPPVGMRVSPEPSGLIRYRVSVAEPSHRVNRTEFAGFAVRCVNDAATAVSALSVIAHVSELPQPPPVQPANVEPSA